MNKKPQWQLVLDHMKLYGSIDNVEAFGMFILRLSNQIRILEQKGYIIEHGHMEGNRAGKYTLLSERPIVQRVSGITLPPAFDVIETNQRHLWPE